MDSIRFYQYLPPTSKPALSKSKSSFLVVPIRQTTSTLQLKTTTSSTVPWQVDSMAELQPSSKSTNEDGVRSKTQITAATTIESVIPTFSQSAHVLPPCGLGITREFVINAFADQEYDKLPEIQSLMAADVHRNFCICCKNIMTSFSSQDDYNEDMEMKIIGIIACKMRTEHLAQQAKLATVLISNSRHHHQHQQSLDGKLGNSFGSEESIGSGEITGQSHYTYSLL
jgi:hypothetical protein